MVRGHNVKRGRGGRGRRRKPFRVISSDEESTREQASSITAKNEQSVITNNQVADQQPGNDENAISKIDMEADISQLEAPTFTTINRGPPKPMLRLQWDHKVNLLGEKVSNPMIHICDQCDKPILIYGRMIPCKHIFCLRCAKAEPDACPRCHDKVYRVEQAGLGSVFMCTFGGTRLGKTGCRRTYLSQRDLEAHANHRHINAGSTQIATEENIQVNARVTIEPHQVFRPEHIRPQTIYPGAVSEQHQMNPYPMVPAIPNMITVPVRSTNTTINVTSNNFNEMQVNNYPVQYFNPVSNYNPAYINVPQSNISPIVPVQNIPNMNQMQHSMSFPLPRINTQPPLYWTPQQYNQPYPSPNQAGTYNQSYTPHQAGNQNQYYR